MRCNWQRVSPQRRFVARLLLRLTRFAAARSCKRSAVDAWTSLALNILKYLGMKTGELFALACDLGAYLSNASVAERRALCGYGMALGTAYQIYDDCLDVFGSEGAAGKSLGSDLAKGKITLPMLVLLEGPDVAISRKLAAIIGDYQPRDFESVVALLRQRGALTESLQVIEHYLRSAREFAAELRASPARMGLVTLCDVLTGQTELLGGVS